MLKREDVKNLTGKVAVVTGAGGVGSVVGARLLSKGAKVIFWDIDAQALKACVDQLTGQYGAESVSGIAVDVRESQLVKKAASDSVAKFGSVDILALCHGVLKTARILELTEEDWDEVIDTNTKGRFLVSQAIAREMISAKSGGVIIDVGSFTGERVVVGRLHYCSGNAVGETLVKAMAVDLGKYGIRVVTISSGPIDTPLLGERARDPERMSRFLENIPLRRLGQPDDVANAVAFIASDEARYWTGGSLALDGGWMAG